MNTYDTLFIISLIGPVLYMAYGLGKFLLRKTYLARMSEYLRVGGEIGCLICFIYSFALMCQGRFTAALAVSAGATVVLAVVYSLEHWINKLPVKKQFRRFRW